MPTPLPADFLFSLKPAKAKNLYREDAKTAKKQQTSLAFLFYFALFASSRWECLIPFLFRAIPCSSVANASLWQ